jgi:hypothetical protein
VSERGLQACFAEPRLSDRILILHLFHDGLWLLNIPIAHLELVVIPWVLWPLWIYLVIAAFEMGTFLLLFLLLSALIIGESFNIHFIFVE